MTPFPDGAVAVRLLFSPESWLCWNWTPGRGVKARVWGCGHGREHVGKLEATLNLGGKVRRGRS